MKRPMGGMGGGMNMASMMKQAQQMSRRVQELQEELEKKEYEISSGGGAVKIVIGGDKQIKSLKISSEIVDPEDIEMLEDIILAGVNEAVKTVEDSSAQAMKEVTGGIGIPGL